jgi:uncharacterized protein (TIGR02118 family)
MIKLSVLYGQPTTPETFEKYYLETHMPIPRPRCKAYAAWSWRR